MICIYHSRDLDGWMSAAIVKLKYPNVKLKGYDYGDVLIDFADDEVILVDISLPPSAMRELGYSHNVTWIDHHVSAIRDSVTNAYTIYKGLRDPLFAACELTWKYFFPEDPMPEIVRLLGRYDCFGHKGTAEEQKVLEFQYGARAVISNPDDAYSMLIECTRTKESEYWFLQAQVVVGNIHELGRGIYKYLCTEAQQTYAKRFTVMFDRYKFAMVNQERFNPINFGIDYHKDGYEGFACVWFQKGKWMYSLYNDNGKVDCSDICKSRGGGGHKGASGFQSDIFLTE
jgi:oligoribonuclease NrnB/cAMP/cGMP phosphodiesterase (DHH superfamily)